MQQGFDEDLYQHVHEYATNEAFTEREKLAIEYAERFALDHREIGDEFFEQLASEFSQEEILELTVTIGFCIGIGRSFTVLDLARDFDVYWSREPPSD